MRDFASTGTTVPRATNKGDGAVTAIAESPEEKREEKSKKHVTFDDREDVSENRYLVCTAYSRNTMQFCYCVSTDLEGELSHF